MLGPALPLPVLPLPLAGLVTPKIDYSAGQQRVDGNPASDPPDAFGRSHRGDEGGRHVAFALSVRPGQLDQLVRELRKRGLPHEGPVDHDAGDRSVYFKDPEGNVVEAWDFFEQGEGGRDGVDALSKDAHRQDLGSAGGVRVAARQKEEIMVNDTLAQSARAAHDWGLASWLGGSMYGQFALNPAVATIDDKRERGKVVNAAWNGYNVINAISLGSVALGWFASRVTETRPDRLTEEERRLAMAKDGLTLVALGTGVASAVQGARLARQEPEGAVPIERGTKPAQETPPAAAKAQRSLAGLGLTNIASGVGLVVVNALLAQRDHSRPPLRRALFRRSR